ncbi:hypothetical protein BofuT4_uP069130.1 [Botrytis cinerea T4]|uniref:Uncharacterized protein n=1 Tax=Botryotinia fuckeliana (strain T4) TaxID=999810 RepID=G2XQG8_BOTF4|nr:hypothetical protein BofuT4_uP069130.1 [Botrytis cinerea T4]
MVVIVVDHYYLWRATVNVKKKKGVKALNEQAVKETALYSSAHCLSHFISR